LLPENKKAKIVIVAFLNQKLLPLRLPLNEDERGFAFFFSSSALILKYLLLIDFLIN
jgi:hypothetical protein